jgi:hypothetical protein
MITRGLPQIHICRTKKVKPFVNSIAMSITSVKVFIAKAALTSGLFFGFAAKIFFPKQLIFKSDFFSLRLDFSWFVFLAR